MRVCSRVSPDRIQLCVIAACAMLAGFASATYTMPITFSGYARTETLTNFPALVVFTNNHGFLSSGGYDLRFWTNSTAVGTPLNYEIELWTNSGNSYVWVQVPELTSNITIYATWGNPKYNFQAACTTNGAMWDNNFKGVWHLTSTNSALSATDSTTNNHNATTVTATNAPGMADGSAGFDGTSARKISFGNISDFNFTDSNFTADLWVYPLTWGANNGAILIGQGYWQAQGWYVFVDNTSGDLRFCSQVPGVEYDLIAYAVVEKNKWQHFVFVRTGWYNAAIYKNGAVIASSGYFPRSASDTSDLFSLGAGPGSTANFHNGRLDEVRISNIARSATWIWAEYMNMASNAVFCNYGAVSVEFVGTAAFFH